MCDCYSWCHQPYEQSSSLQLTKSTTHAMIHRYYTAAVLVNKAVWQNCSAVRSGGALYASFERNQIPGNIFNLSTWSITCVGVCNTKKRASFSLSIENRRMLTGIINCCDNVVQEVQRLNRAQTKRKRLWEIQLLEYVYVQIRPWASTPNRRTL